MVGSIRPSSRFLGEKMLENIDFIRKNLGKKIILIDRFIDSTIAYQHYGMGVNRKLIENINNGTSKT